MKTKDKILNAARYAGGFTLTIGIITFFLGFIVSGSSILTPIGIGAVMGAVFIYLIGVFFVVTEEMQEKAYKGIPITE